MRISAFNESSIDLMVYCFTRTTDWNEWLKAKEALTYAIKSLVEGAGARFAFPSRSLYVESVPAGTEVFPLHRPVPDEQPAPSEGARGNRDRSVSKPDTRIT
ncbi:MAG: hypothetical protein AB7G13_13000 [Lautropia sp.]